MTTIQSHPVSNADETPMHVEIAVTDNLDDLLAVLPERIADAVRAMMDNRDDPGLIELVLDLGRRPEARFQDGAIRLSDDEITREDLSQVAHRIGRFGDDNRAGIERTLHRISAIRNRTGDIVGLTCRVGRAVYGTIGIISDLVESGESILLLGRPGVGKTTMLREVARVLADDLEKRVVVVDTSNEIAGDGDIPHPSIGRARRMQVPTPALQHAVMIEAVENHMPEVIVIDEIGTELEAGAARTIAERGVQLIGTAHGNTLENLMMNPTLSDLIGGIQSVTLSDEEARRRGTQKSILERKAPPTFGVMVEIRERDVVAVVRDVEGAVDAILRGQQQRAELRERGEDGEMVITDIAPVRPERADRHERVDRHPARASHREDSRVIESGGLEAEPEAEQLQRNPLARGRGTPQRPVRIFPFGVSRNRLEQAIGALALPALIVRDVHEADMALTLKNYYRQRPQQLREAETRGVAIYVLRANTVVQMVNVLRDLVREVRPDDLPDGAPLATVTSGDGDPITNAMYEAEEAITAVLDGAPPIELRPQAPYIRRLQHQLADRYNLGSRSRGREPQRHVEIYREGGWS
ncbi:MAG: R3H domain-containing nucleic acid-binding protein [Thermomicrobiales bacterium]